MAQVELDKRLVEQAQQLVAVAESNVQMAIAQLAEAKANVGKYQAEVVRWESEVEATHANGGGKGRGPANPHGNAATIRFAKAARDAAQATVAAREADP